MIARILRPAFSVRRSLLILGTVVAALAFPAGAMAKLFTLNTHPVRRSEGFMVHVHAYNTCTGCAYGGAKATSFTVVLTRTRGHVTQTDDYSFNHGVKLGGKANLSKAVIHGTLPDGRGSINMTFHATGRPHNVPAGCGVPQGKERSGTFRGSLRLKADKLGTVTLTSVKATLSAPAKQCNPGSPKGYFLEGFGGITTPIYYVSAGKRSSTGPVRETISLTRSGGSLPGGGYAWTFEYAYEAAKEPTSDYEVPSLACATVKGASGIHGSATYKNKAASGSSHCPATSSHHTNGHLTGNLSVNMATIGDVSPFAKNSKMQADQRHS